MVGGRGQQPVLANQAQVDILLNMCTLAGDPEHNLTLG